MKIIYILVSILLLNCGCDCGKKSVTTQLDPIVVKNENNNDSLYWKKSGQILRIELRVYEPNKWEVVTSPENLAYSRELPDTYIPGDAVYDVFWMTLRQGNGGNIQLKMVDKKKDFLQNWGIQIGKVEK